MVLRCRRLLPITLMLVVVTCSLGGEATDEALYMPLRMTCPAEGGNFSTGSMYQASVDGLANILSTNAATNDGFLNISFGDPRDEAFGIIWCFVDSSWADYKKCLDKAPSYVSTACPNGGTGALLYKECVLRYSDESFASMKSDELDHWFVEYVDHMGGINKTRWKMMSQLITEAAKSPQRFAIANGSEGLTGVHGLLQCRRDLTPDECTKCLSSKVQYLLDNYPNNSAANNRGRSCFAKYHPC
ncbi:putative lectin-domain receptor-like protein kinase family protein [Panicum miliaceum]|uniref:Lectin-domain receptor-like protein kinase family protein n=1 Tax=Panicum miliaceum TaxID=4540 RepID=A0A3L6Q5T8_PANMI|nr:putative lectin-domain receptor-like protein kinase family protein [Panicum miliaceum]